MTIGRANAELPGCVEHPISEAQPLKSRKAATQKSDGRLQKAESVYKKTDESYRAYTNDTVPRTYSGRGEFFKTAGKKWENYPVPGVISIKEVGIKCQKATNMRLICAMVPLWIS